MKIYVVVKYTDVEVSTNFGETNYVTETEVIEAYGNKRDASFEASYRDKNKIEDNVLYDVQELELL